MKKFLLAPFLAALAMFMWGFIYWGTPHYLPYRALERVADDAAVGDALNKLFPVSGAYLVPSMMLGQDKVEPLIAKGPLAQVIIKKEGGPPMEPGVMLKGFVHTWVLALALAIVLVRREQSFRCWTCRVRFAAAIGLIVALCQLGNAIWWNYPLGWAGAMAFYDFVLFAIAGLVLAKFVTPKAEAPATSQPDSFN